MSAGALIGFGLAFVVLSWTCSTVLAGALALRRGPGDAAVARVEAGLAVLLPPVVALAVTLALVAHSIRQLAIGGDHCAPHAHHLHLCTAHGAPWASDAGAVALAAVLGVLASGRLAHVVARHLRAARALRVLAREASTRGDVAVVASERAFLFAAGLIRSRIYMLTSAWDALDASARAGAIAHERAHVHGRDVLWRAALASAAILGAPFVARRALARWDRATERLRDQDAAAAVGSAEDVAAALLLLARRGAQAPGWASASLVPRETGAADVAGRIDALLSGAAPRRAHARRLARTAGAGAATIVALAIAFADPLHHALETVLGVF